MGGLELTMINIKRPTKYNIYVEIKRRINTHG